MALYRLEFLISSDVDVTNGTTTVTLNDGQDVSSVVPGTAVFINNQVVEAISGQNISPTQSTITLRYNWPFATVTAGRLVAFNTFEGLNTAITRLNDVISSVPDFTGATGQGLLYNDGTDTYTIKASTVFGESLLNAADASSALSILQSPDYPSFAGQAGILKKDALDVYSLVTSTAFGESLLSQNNASSARSTLGVVSATESTEGLIRKQTLAEALDGTDDSGAMSSIRVHQAFQQYGLGADSVAVATQDLDLGRSTGCYIASLSTNKPPAGASEGFWKTLQYDLANYSLQEWTDFGSALPRKFFRTEASGVFTDWFEVHTTLSLVDAQNVSGSNIPPNNTVAGSSLSPPQAGTWRNVCGSDVANNGYGLFKKD